MRREIIAAPEGIALDELASRVRYVGSSEHKSFPSFAGPPKMRADATKCDPHLTDPEEITAWLRGGVEAGHIGAPWEGDFPRYVWAQVQGIYYEARLVNRGSGGYKGWSVEASEFPKAIR